MQRIGASICKDCGQPFITTDRELQTCEEKGYPLPKRCKPCRVKRKAENFNKPLRDAFNRNK